jgi:hypothetical protein
MDLLNEMKSDQQFIDELTYLNYRYNRQHSPDIKADTWVAVYGQNTYSMERRYLQELING